MKSIYSIVQFVSLFLLGLCITITPSCRDPHEYEPPFDSLSPPPDPALLFTPEDNANFMYDMWHQYPNDIEMIWSTVPGTQYYELKIDTDPTLPGKPEKVEDTTFIFSVSSNGEYYWKVRAYSRTWTWYTEWSETRRFVCYYSP